MSVVDRKQSRKSIYTILLRICIGNCVSIPGKKARSKRHRSYTSLYSLGEPNFEHASSPIHICTRHKRTQGTDDREIVDLAQAYCILNVRVPAETPSPSIIRDPIFKPCMTRHALGKSNPGPPCEMHTGLSRQSVCPPFICARPFFISCPWIRCVAKLSSLDHPLPLLLVVSYEVGLGFICKLCKYVCRYLCARHGVCDISYLSLATSHRHVDESSGVCYSLLRPSLRSLLLLLGFDLRIESIISIYPSGRVR